MNGGEKLISRLRAMAGKAGEDTSVRVGFLEGATYPDGTPVALVAAVNEYGRPEHNQPPRPFFRDTVAKHKQHWPRALEKELRANDYDGEAALKRAGELIKGQLQTTIVTMESPPLAASTVKRKGFSKPLIDTNHMRNSVDYEVNR